jgi:hypothetical protein
MSPDGAMAANNVAAKLIQNEADGDAARNPSGFVRKSCSNARHDRGI